MKHLREGMKAPDFRATDQHGEEISLSQYLGKKVVLYFYPKDNTPGCTAEACNLRDNYDLLISKGYVILGVSPDSAASHKKFIDQHGLPFPLIPDPEKKILNDYGVWGPKKFMGREYDGVHRMTFVISEDGNILKIFEKVETKAHAEQILAAIENN